MEILRVSADAAIADLSRGTVHFGPLIIALQWLALNRDRAAKLLRGAG